MLMAPVGLTDRGRTRLLAARRCVTGERCRQNAVILTRDGDFSAFAETAGLDLVIGPTAG